VKAKQMTTAALVLVSAFAVITATAVLAETMEQGLGRGLPNGCGQPAAAVVNQTCGTGG
jgi:hypothetical protein